MATLVTLAEQILKHARTLESNLSSTSSPLPSLEATKPWTFPSPETSSATHRTRTTLLALLRDALALTLSPTEHIRTIANTQRMDFVVLQTVVYYAIHRHIPQHPDSISFDDLAKKLNVDRDPLERILRHGFTIRLFREPVGKPGRVQHTALSMAVEGLAPWLRLVGWEKVERALGRIPEGISLAQSRGSGAVGNGEDFKSNSLENGDGEKSSAKQSTTPFEIANGEPFFSAVQSEPEVPQRPSHGDDSISIPTGNSLPMSAFSASMKSHAGVQPFPPFKQAAEFVQGSDIFSRSSETTKNGTSTTCHNHQNATEHMLIDVGGGNGYIAYNLAQLLPSTSISHILVQDLPSNQGPAQQTASLFPKEIQARINFQVQDFFTPQPKNLQPKAYFLRSILHDWSDADCVRIVRNLLPAMKGKHRARLFVMDRFLPDVPGVDLPQDYLLREYMPARAADEDQLVLPVNTEAFQRHMDLLMFALLGAKERSLRQWRELFRMVDEGLEVLRWEVPLGAETGVLEVGFREL